MIDLARELSARCPACTVYADVRPAGDGFEAHVELRFPQQHQVIFNAAAASADAAAREALARLGGELRRLRSRDAALFRFDARQAA